MRLSLILALLIALPAVASAQPFVFSIADQGVSYDPLDGEASFQISPTIDDAAGSPGSTLGFSMSIAHDPAVLTATVVDTTGVLSGVRAGLGPEFFGVNIVPEGITVGCVYTLDVSETLSFSSPEAVITVDYDADAALLIGDVSGFGTDITFTDGITAPAVLNGVIVDISEFAPTTEDGTIDFEPTRADFIRGDTDENGEVAFIDAIVLLFYLTGTGSTDCEDAFDVNDDGGLDIADGVYLLEYLFTLGAEPPAPFGSCDLDTTVESIECSDHGGCP